MSAALPVWLAARYPADQRAAVDHLRPLMDPHMLQEIAASDYGEDATRHLEELELIHQGAPLGDMHYWYPMEVLELTRWAEPDTSNAVAALHDHTIRAFVCAVLLATPNFEADKTTLILMVESVQFLGGKAPAAMARFLAWKQATLKHEDDRHFFVLALVGLVALNEPALALPEQQDLAEWLSPSENEERAYAGGFDPSEFSTPWPLGLTTYDAHVQGWWNLLVDLADKFHDGPLGKFITEKLDLSRS
jgi:hypothetical protein